jgi:hypothetical protein
MPTYVVDRELPGISMDDLGAAQQRAISTADEMRSDGQDVRYIRSMYVPGDAECHCLFEAPDADTVKALNDKAQIPYTGVREAMDLSPS